jgi:hypothetical protein
MNEKWVSKQIVGQVRRGHRWRRHTLGFRKIVKGLGKNSTSVIPVDSLFCHAIGTGFGYMSAQDGRHSLIASRPIGEPVPPITALAGEKDETSWRCIGRTQSDLGDLDNFARSAFGIVQYDQTWLALLEKFWHSAGAGLRSLNKTSTPAVRLFKLVADLNQQARLSGATLACL